MLDPVAHVLTCVRPIIAVPDLEWRRPIGRIINGSVSLQFALIRLSQFAVLELDVGPLHLLVRAHSLLRLQQRRICLVELQALLNSALVISEHRMLRIPVIVLGRKCRPGCTDLGRSLLVDYVLRVSLSIALRRSDERQLFLHKLIVDCVLVDLLLSEGAHASIEGVHGP